MTLSINQASPSSSIIDRLEQRREEQDERLASGRRINGADDDAAGLQIASRLTAQENQLAQQSVNAQDQINTNNLQSAQLSSIGEGLQRANVLSIQSGNPLSDNNAVQGELDQLTEQINTIASEALGVGGFISGLDASDPAATQAAIDTAFASISELATASGAQSNALEGQVATYETSRVNVSQSRSAIQDANIASTTAEQQQVGTLLQAAVINKQDEEARKGLLVDKLV